MTMSFSLENRKWRIGHWKKRTGKIITCHNGFHASLDASDAFKYAMYVAGPSPALCLVEFRGMVDREVDKIAASEMRILYKIDEASLRAVMESLLVYWGECIRCRLAYLYCRNRLGPLKGNKAAEFGLVSSIQKLKDLSKSLVKWLPSWMGHSSELDDYLSLASDLHYSLHIRLGQREITPTRFKVVCSSIVQLLDKNHAVRFDIQEAMKSLLPSNLQTRL